MGDFWVRNGKKLAILVVLWASLIAVMSFISPTHLRDIGVEGWYLPFQVIVFLTMLTTSYIVSRKLKVAIIVGIAVEVILVLGLLRVLNPATALIIMLLTLVIFKI